MRVWLLHIGERLSVDGTARRYRYGFLAEALRQRGHEVLRWAPTFSHVDKTHRFQDDRRVEVEPNFAVQFVHARGYQRNVSVARIFAYKELGRRIRQLFKREPRPDLIVAAIPSLEWAAAATEFGRTHDVPVAIDVRDLWPDIFEQWFPSIVRPIGRGLLYHYRQLARQVCREATAIVGVSQGYVDSALRLGARSQSTLDASMPLGYEPELLSPEVLQGKVSDLRSRGINPGKLTCMFAGSFERSYDLKTVLEGAHAIQKRGRSDVQFLLCGDGSKRAKLERFARERGLRNVHFLGWLDPAALQAVAHVSHIGLCAYVVTATQGLPNKPFEYMAGRLAIVSSLQGELQQLLSKCQCGTTYAAGSSAAFVAAINQFAVDPALLEHTRDRGFEAWQMNYRSTLLYDQFANHLTSIAECPRSCCCPQEHLDAA